MGKGKIDYAFLEKKILQIKQDHVHGSGYLAKRALRLFFLATRFPAKTKKELLTKLRKFLRRVSIIKPAMQSISNLSRQFFREILKEKNLELLRSKADTLLKKLLEQSRNALKVSAQKASDFLKNDDLVITASLSRAVFETLKVAKKQGKRFEVCICESRSGKYSYGRLMGKLLSKSRIPNRIIEDENINRLKGADMILIGADSFFRNGSVINGTPSYNLALWGKSKGIPIYVVCESFKEGGRRPKNLQEGFDLIPPKLVKAIITEKWIRYPSSKKSCKDLRIAKER